MPNTHKSSRRTSSRRKSSRRKSSQRKYRNVKVARFPLSDTDSNVRWSVGTDLLEKVLKNRVRSTRSPHTRAYRPYRGNKINIVKFRREHTEPVYGDIDPLPFRTRTEITEEIDQLRDKLRFDLDDYQKIMHRLQKLHDAYLKAEDDEGEEKM